MHAQKILVPVDFSELNDAALQYATSLALDTGAKLLILHVDDPTLYVSGAGEAAFYITPPEDRDAVRHTLEAFLPTDSRVTHEHHLLSGDPATAIVRFAEEEHVDLIVMATHGRTGLTRLLMGSVAEAVVRRAPCPVFTLKQPAGAVAAT